MAEGQIGSECVAPQRYTTPPVWKHLGSLLRQLAVLGRLAIVRRRPAKLLDRLVEKVDRDIYLRPRVREVLPQGHEALGQRVRRRGVEPRDQAIERSRLGAQVVERALQ